MKIWNKIINRIGAHHALPSPISDLREGQAERNAARLEAIKQEMGEKWILHPSHKAQKLQTPRPV